MIYYKKYKRSKVMILNNKHSIAIFTVCCLFSLNVLAHGRGLVGGLIRLGEESLGKPRGVPKVITSSMKTTDGHFDRTLDEILEIKELRRGDIPEQVINQLRNATEDPLKLIDGSLDVDVDRFFSPRLPGDPNFDEHIDLYRAFLQKRLDPGNTKQMERLKNLVDELWIRRMPESDDLNTPRYSVLYALTKHSGINPDEFDVWYANLRIALYKREEFFKEIAEKAFKEGFDEDTFYHYWEDEAFRKFIVDSHFMTKTHLTGNPKLLVRWAEELEHEQGMEQFSVLIRSLFEGTDNPDEVTRVTNNDPFFRTVTRAFREDNNFLRRTQPLLRENIPLSRERERETLIRLMGELNVGEWS